MSDAGSLYVDVTSPNYGDIATSESYTPGSSEPVAGYDPGTSSMPVNSAASGGFFGSLTSAASALGTGVESLFGFNGTQNAANGSYPPPAGYNAVNPATPAAATTSSLPTWFPIAAIGGVGLILLMMSSKRKSSGNGKSRGN